MMIPKISRLRKLPRCCCSKRCYSQQKLHSITPSAQRARDQSNRYWDPKRKAYKYKLVNHVGIGKSIHPQISSQIDKAKSGNHVLSIIKKHRNEITNVAIYNKAMQRSSKLKDSKSVQSIMDMLLSSKSMSPDAISFSTIINAMAKSTSPELCIEYFEKMESYAITPNVIVFGALLKSFKKQSLHSNDSNLAETYFNAMSSKYGIKPNEHCYSEMMSIYSRTRQIKKGVHLFNEYLLKIEDETLTPSVTVFSSYLTLFCRCGHIKGMKSALSVISDFGFKLDQIMVSELMRGYVLANRYSQCMEILNTWIRNGGSPNHVMLNMKISALKGQITQNIESRKDADGPSIVVLDHNNHELYCEMREVIESEYKVHGLDMDPAVVPLLLEAAILVFSESDPGKVVDVFEWLTQRMWMSILGKDMKSIDVHGMEPVVARFIIRYVFAHLDQYVQDGQDGLTVIVGQGQGSLREVLERELKSWRPQITCHVVDNYMDKLIINREDMGTYLNVGINYARRILNKPWKACQINGGAGERDDMEDSESIQITDDCRFCGKSYKRRAYLEKHELKCSQRIDA